MDKVKNKLLDNGITVENIGKGASVFMGISVAWIGILWTSCYFVSPSKTMLRNIPIKYVQNAFNNLNNSKVPHFIEKFPEAIRGRAGIAFCEMVVVKALVAPVSLPLKIALTIKILSQWTN